jgi:hypothetical protein
MLPKNSRANARTGLIASVNSIILAGTAFPNGCLGEYPNSPNSL